MNISPAANRSFLHGDRKLSEISYATLDSLALKRARLPLQLLPADPVRGNVEKKPSESETKHCCARWSNNKVDATDHPTNSPAKGWASRTRNPEIEPGENPGSPTDSGDAVDNGTSEDNAGPEATLVESDNNEPDRSINVPCNDENESSSAREKHAVATERTESRLSDDYEKIELTRGESNTYYDSDDEKRISYSTGLLLQSASSDDIATKNSLNVKMDDRENFLVTVAGSYLNEELFSLDAEQVFPKTKKHLRNVLYFVPSHLTKRPKKPKNPKNPKNPKKPKKSLSCSLNTLDPFTDHFASNSHRSRSLSREELKFVISSPSNFVHVASATNPNLVSNENTVRSSLEQVVITHQRKCATLPLLVATDKRRRCKAANENDHGSKATLADSSNDEDRIPRKSNTVNRIVANRNGESAGIAMATQLSAKVLEQSQRVKTKTNESNVREGRSCRSDSPSRIELRANSSFLWSSQTKNLLENNNQRPSSERNEHDTDTETYDDVGHPDSAAQEEHYDDVGSPALRIDRNRRIEPLLDSEIYDDVVSPFGDVVTDNCLPPAGNPTSVSPTNPNSEDETASYQGHYLVVSNEYSSVDEDNGDDAQGVYDDVGLPGEERVNSLYAGSAASVLGLASGKESEWEDLEETSVWSARKSNSWRSLEGQIVQSKKKFGQKWSRKVRRQRSRASKKGDKSLARPVHDSPAMHVAVSLGRGTVLLVGCAARLEEWSTTEPTYANTTGNSQRTQGLVQMRIIDLDEDTDTQETSCYVHEGPLDDTSDDSTYESLRCLRQDDFSSDSETECVRKEIGSGHSPDQSVNRFEAPTRPNPPPPREASLTQTLGRRIKMLRRTWSITKGSLGRMTRRTSVEDEAGERESTENSDGGKYFNFARHFRKSVTGLSTFYLDGSVNGNNSRNCSAKEPIYSNTNWYRQHPGNDSSPSPQSRIVSDHYSVLADQEPLYQFYAAAAARVAFDSDSDGYEEVEDMIPSRVTTDLAKPGQRTLWCQTPQVIKSGLLNRLTAEERKIQEAKFEILTSEASYLNSLRVLENEFLSDPTLINEILTASEKDKLFGSIPSVLQASAKFLAELENVWRQDPMLNGLPNVLIKYADTCLDVYVAYCSNQVSIDTTLKDLRTRKGLKFLEAMSQIETRPTCQSLSFHSFLMLPMQRVTRLPLLADAILSRLSMEHADRSQWEKVLSSLSYVVAECNEGARAAAKDAEMDVFARKLEYSAKIKPVTLKGRYLVRSGPVVQLLTKADAEYKLTFGKKFNKTPLYLLLLTDYLLVTKFKSNTQEETYNVIDTCKRSLIALEPVPEDSPLAGRNGMLLTLLENHSGHQVEYVLTCESNTERQRWLEAVSPTKRGLVGETLYEAWDCPQVVALYSYSPNQPDELSLQPGDVINVLRKMTDGWYHGEKLLDGEQGWFPGNYTKEVASEHVRARNLKQRHRLLALSGSMLRRRAKQQPTIY